MRIRHCLLLLVALANVVLFTILVSSLSTAKTSLSAAGTISDLIHNPSDVLAKANPSKFLKGTVPDEDEYLFDISPHSPATLISESLASPTSSTSSAQPNPLDESSQKKPQAKSSKKSKSNDPNSKRCEDPYRRPGHLVLPPLVPDRRARWLPFYEEDLANTPDYSEFGLFFDPDSSESNLDDAVLEHAPISWTTSLMDYIDLLYHPYGGSFYSHDHKTDPIKTVPEPIANRLRVKPSSIIFNPHPSNSLLSLSSLSTSTTTSRTAKPYSPTAAAANQHANVDKPTKEVNDEKQPLAVQKQSKTKQDKLERRWSNKEKNMLRLYKDQISWLRNRRILIMADSVDRFMLKFMCESLRAQYESKVVHTTAECSIPHLNFTIFHWHVASMAHYRPQWWFQPIMEHVSFEDRYQKIFKSTLPKVIGMDGRAPDLILFQSLLWDEKMFLRSQLYAIRQQEIVQGQTPSTISEEEVGIRLPYWSELRFYADRLNLFLGFVRKIFGNEVPIMYRTAIPKQADTNATLFVHGLDRMARFIAYNHSIETFEWGRMVQGFPEMYKDHIHIGKSPLSFLYGDMLLHYLFRALGGVEYRGEVTIWPVERSLASSKSDLWNECHEQNMVLVNP
ncbi:uncharacterized protein V1516DRAFT_676846 [Lipomyces oligophaga]|uniref:uncharacterized protein n=1 Tax=Lipomyces oligophaga TaxID=45792 RepID=UPI0034CD9880